MKVTKDQKNKYMNLLSGHQLDIKYIVLRYRLPGHKLSVEEIISEINFKAAKHAETAIIKNLACLTKEGFSKLMFAICYNNIMRTAHGLSQRDFDNRHKIVPDKIVNHDNGETLLSLALKSLSSNLYEDSEQELNFESKRVNIVKWIEDYSDFLNENELNVFKQMRKGYSKKEISNNMGVSHQMISVHQKNLFEKIKSYIKLDFCTHSDESKIKTAFESINRLFSK